MKPLRFCASFLWALTTYQAVWAGPGSDVSEAYSEQEVTIEAPTAGIRLAGTLTVPAGRGPFPAVLLLPGQGPHTRDQVISGSPMFRQIGDHLSRQGFAVLRMDKRGVGRSQGPSLDESTLADLTQDFRACHQFLHKQPAVDSRRVSLLGHSEGAMIGPMIACKEPGIWSLVLLAPPAVAGGEIWIHQKLGGLRQQGAKPEVLESVEKEMHRLVQFVKSGTNDDDTYYRIGHDFIKAHRMPEEQITHSLIDKLLSDLRTKSCRDFFSYNPAEALRELRTPTLAILSSADDQVTVKQNLVPLAAALASAKNPDFTISVLPEQDHYFLVFEGHRLKRHNFGKMKVAPVLLDTVTTWLRRPAPST